MENKILEDSEIKEMEEHWYRMANDPYFPSDSRILSLILEVKKCRKLQKF